MPAFDYSVLADIYDDFCVFDADLGFFRELARQAGGPVLELMAGTGRVSLPMLEGGVDLTCVDSSPAMLAILRRKLAARGLCASTICADVCRLPLKLGYELVVLPFQGFCELVGETEQRGLMEEAARVLAPGRRFVCTSHNPAVRRATIDGRWHEIGRFENDAARTLVLNLRTDYSNRPEVVVGQQKVEVFDPRGRLMDTREVDLEFSLVEPDEIISQASSVGLRVVELMGDYGGSVFDPSSSPAFIAVLEKCACKPPGSGFRKVPEK